MLFEYPDDAAHSEGANLMSAECGNIRERLWLVDRVSSASCRRTMSRRIESNSCQDGLSRSMRLVNDTVRLVER